MVGVLGGEIGDVAGMELLKVTLRDVVRPKVEAGKDGRRGSGNVERPRSFGINLSSVAI